MKPAKRRLIVDLPFANLRPALFGAVALLSYRALSVPASAQEPVVPAPTMEVMDVPLSDEGKPLLAGTVLVAAALVGMERFCSWRLGARRHQANGQVPELAECLPPVLAPAPEL